MLERVYIDNYRCLVNFELVLPDFAVLIGGNGSGKSAFIDALIAIQRLVLRGHACAEAFPHASRTRWDARNRQEFELDLRDGEMMYGYRLVIAHEGSKVTLANESLLVNGETVAEYDARGRLLTQSREATIPAGLLSDDSLLAGLRDPPAERFRSLLGGLWLLRLQPVLMTALSLEESAWLEFDGSNYASWYRRLALAQPEAIGTLFTTLKQVIPDFRALRLQQHPKGWRLVADFVIAEARYSVDFDELSDGQRVLIVLYTLLRVDLGGRVTLLLDEPTNFVELAEVQPFFVELTDRLDDIGRALVVSHHPEVIDYLAGHDVIRFDRRAAGQVRAHPLDIELEPGIKLSEIVQRRLLDEP